MKWFTGSINDAVATSKSRKAVFVVFVAGDNEASNESTKIIDSPEISSRLEQDDFVAVRLESDTEAYKFFAQIYKVVPVPSLFFIGTNGAPMEVIADNITVENLQVKIDSILERIGKSKNSSNEFIKTEQDSGAVGNIPGTSSSNEARGSQQNIEPKKSEASKSSSQVDESSNTTLLNEQDKIERARQLIELQRQQKAEKEKEDERRRELERRKMGRDIQLAKQKQQELEVTIALEERAKERELERAAKERVKQQIAQDKLERKQREQAVLQQFQQTQEQIQPTVSTPADGMTRIQFRLPSGSPHLGKFQVTSTLRDLRSYVLNNIELPFRQFSMSTSFPRKDLNAEDDGKTLIELELVPTAVVLILPLKNTSSVVPSGQDVGFLSSFVWTVFSPIISIYNYVFSYFTGPPAPAATGESSRPQNEGNSTGGASPRPQNRGQPSGLINRNLGGTSSTVRAGGNIHRLHSGRDDNDENNTWNGNSTQQM